MSFTTKFFISALVLFALGCEQEAVRTRKKKIPCEERKEISKTFTAWDSVAVVVKIVPICDESYTITYKEDGETKKKGENGLYKVVIQLPNDTAEYDTKEIIDNNTESLDDFFSQVLFDESGFNESDTSVIIYNVLAFNKMKHVMKWKVKFNSGFEFIDN